MKNVKKIAILLTVLAMLLGCCASVWAAPSPVAAKERYQMKTKDTFDNDDDKAAVEKLLKDPTAVLAELGIKGNLKLIKVVDAYAYDTVNNVAEESYENTISGTITDVDVKASDKVIAIHFTKGAWKQEKAKAGDGFVTVTLEGCCPVAIFVDLDGTATAPQTGEKPIAAVLITIMAAAAVGMFFSRKRNVA